MSGQRAASFVTTTVQNPDFISILLPSRGRPEMLARLFASIQATTERLDLIDVWVYADADDAPTLDFLRNEAPARYGLSVHAHCGPRTHTNGERFNALRAHNPAGPGIYMFISDKIAFTTPAWDAQVRRAYGLFPDRILFAYPRDSMNNEGFGAFGFLSAEWANATGRLMTEHFPYWFDDTWINQVASMVGRGLPLDFDVEVEFGMTASMQNLSFWQRFFKATIDDRATEAEALRAAILAKGGEAAFIYSQDTGRVALANIRSNADIGPAEQADITGTERNVSAVLRLPCPQDARTEGYRLAEANAVAHLMDGMIPLANQGRTGDVDRAFDALLHSLRAAEDLLARARRAVDEEKAGPNSPLVAAMVKRFPNFPETYMLAADACLARDQADDALTLLAFAMQLFPKVTDFPKRLGVVKYLAGDRSGAVAAFQQVLTQEPDDVDTLISLGNLALEDEGPAAARPLFEAASATGLEIDAFIGLMRCAAALGDAAAYEAALHRARALDPTHPDVRGA